MRSEIEFKNEVLARFEKEKSAQKKRQRRLFSLLIPLIAAGVISTVFLGYGLPKIIGGLEKSFDGAEFENAADIGFADEEIADNEKNDGATDGAGLPENEAADMYSSSLAGIERIYNDSADIEEFRALIGELSPFSFENENQFSATGAIILLEPYNEAAEKYIVTHDAVYSSDMTRSRKLSKDEVARIVRFLNEKEN